MSSLDESQCTLKSQRHIHNPFVLLARIPLLEGHANGSWSIPYMPTELRRLATKRRPSEVFGETVIDASPPGEVIGHSGQRKRPVARSALGHERHRRQVEELATRQSIESMDNEHICIRLHRPDRQGHYSAERVRMTSNSSQASTPRSRDDHMDDGSEISDHQTSPQRDDVVDTLSEETVSFVKSPVESRDVVFEGGADVFPVLSTVVAGNDRSKNIFEQFSSSCLHEPSLTSPSTAEQFDESHETGGPAGIDADTALCELTSASDVLGVREIRLDESSKEMTKKMKVIIMPTDTNIATSSCESSPTDRLHIVEMNTKRKRVKSSTKLRGRKRKRRLRYERSQTKLSRMNRDQIVDRDVFDVERCQSLAAARTPKTTSRATGGPSRSAVNEKSSKPRKASRSKFQSNNRYSQRDGAVKSPYGKKPKPKRRTKMAAVVSDKKKKRLVSLTTDVLHEDVSTPAETQSAGSSLVSEAAMSEDSSVEGLLLLTTQLNEAFSMRSHVEGESAAGESRATTPVTKYQKKTERNAVVSSARAAPVMSQMSQDDNHEILARELGPRFNWLENKIYSSMKSTKASKSPDSLTASELPTTERTERTRTRRSDDEKPNEDGRKRRHSDGSTPMSVVGSQEAAIQAAEAILSLSSYQTQHCATPCDRVGAKQSSSSTVTTVRSTSADNMPSMSSIAVCSSTPIDMGCDESLNERRTVHQHDKVVVQNVVSRHGFHGNVQHSMSRPAKNSPPAFNQNADDVYKFDWATPSPDVTTGVTGEYDRRPSQPRDQVVGPGGPGWRGGMTAPSDTVDDGNNIYRETATRNSSNGIKNQPVCTGIKPPGPEQLSTAGDTVNPSTAVDYSLQGRRLSVSGSWGTQRELTSTVRDEHRAMLEAKREKLYQELGRINTVLSRTTTTSEEVASTVPGRSLDATCPVNTQPAHSRQTSVKILVRSMDPPLAHVTKFDLTTYTYMHCCYDHKTATRDFEMSSKRRWDERTVETRPVESAVVKRPTPRPDWQQCSVEDSSTVVAGHRAAASHHQAEMKDYVRSMYDKEMQRTKQMVASGDGKSVGADLRTNRIPLGEFPASSSPTISSEKATRRQMPAVVETNRRAVAEVAVSQPATVLVRPIRPYNALGAAVVVPSVAGELLKPTNSALPLPRLRDIDRQNSRESTPTLVPTETSWTSGSASSTSNRSISSTDRGRTVQSSSLGSSRGPLDNLHALVDGRPSERSTLVQMSSSYSERYPPPEVLVPETAFHPHSLLPPPPLPGNSYGVRPPPRYPGATVPGEQLLQRDTRPVMTSYELGAKGYRTENAQMSSFVAQPQHIAKRQVMGPTEPSRVQMSLANSFSRQPPQPLQPHQHAGSDMASGLGHRIHANSQQPMQRMSNKTELEYKCATCGKQASFVCSACTNVPYCSPECQATSWRHGHSAVCCSSTT